MPAQPIVETRRAYRRRTALLSLAGGWTAGSVTGTYVHGLLENRGFLELLFGEGVWPDFGSSRLASLDRLAEALESAVDVGALLRAVDGGRQTVV